jgi:hypothetical protein
MLRKAKKRRDSGTRSRVSKRAIKDAEHLAYVRRNPCIVCYSDPRIFPKEPYVLGWPAISDPHHCRKLDQRRGLLPRHDALTVPLCRYHHKAMDGDEREYWKALGIDPAASIAAFSEEGRKAIEALSLRGEANP